MNKPEYTRRVKREFEAYEKKKLRKELYLQQLSQRIYKLSSINSKQQ